MPVEGVDDKTTIAGTIVGADEAMEQYTATARTKVRLVGRLSSRICRAIVVTFFFKY